jgi:catechol 2,3-dioxygenase-like lactoylglutathione lyase family enzyme
METEGAMSASVHISLNVSDLEQSVAFYRGLFGEPAKLKTDYAKFVSADPEIHLALQPGLDAPGNGPLSHLGIRAELKARGVVSEEEKREACCYALQEKFWLSDPDGNRWEVYTVLEDLDHESRAGDDAAACCCRQPRLSQ